MCGQATLVLLIFHHFDLLPLTFAQKKIIKYALVTFFTVFVN